VKSKRPTFVLWATDSGTMGFIWSSRSDNMIRWLRVTAQGFLYFLVSWGRAGFVGSESCDALLKF
jgi:hypothetical protein